MGKEPDEVLHVLLGLTGSVASIKAVELVQSLKQGPDNPTMSKCVWKRVEVRVIVTERALHFFDLDALKHASDGVYLDDDEWHWSKRGDPVLHIELTKWADIFVVAPADALTVSKLARGHCDNLLTCALLAWPLPASKGDVLPASGRNSKPLVVCPSMNTYMLAHPATVENLRLIRSFGIVVEGPVSKKLMCGDVGSGAMQEPNKVAERVFRTAAAGKVTGSCLSICDGDFYWVLATASVVAIAGCARFFISQYRN